MCCHLGSLGSFKRVLWVVGFIWVRTCGCRVHSVSLGKFGRALGVVGFVRVRWVHFHAARWLSGSFGFDVFNGARHCGRSFHSGVPCESLGSFGYA